MGGGRQPGISPVIQGGDTGSTTVRVRVVVYVRQNDEGDGGNPRGVPSSDHGEAGESAGIWGMGDTGGGGSITSRGDAVGRQVNRTLEGNSDIVSGHTPNYGGLRVRDWLQGGSQEETTEAETGEDRGGT